MQIRLDSFLSKYGVSSRRGAKDLINDGRVSVNGAVVYEVIKVDETKDLVTVEGKKIEITNLKKRYIMLNKPLMVLSSTTDDRDRKTVLDIVDVSETVYPVGRLDYNSTGLILLTNDGDFALKLTHPRFHVPKTYVVEAKWNITEAQLRKMCNGVEIDGEITLPCEISRLDSKTFEITLQQGLKRQIREMCKAVGSRVETLERVAIGNLELGDLKPGEYRDLTDKEVKQFL